MAVIVEQAAPQAQTRSAVLWLIPLACAALGLLVRFLAYANTVDAASVANFAEGLCRWDCGWYVRLSEEGYDPFPVPSMINAGNWAFFPLYPLLVGALRMATGLPTMVVATATSILLSVVAARVAWPLLGREIRAYSLFCAFLLAGPFAVYFTTFYTEVLFLTLTLCVFAALQRRDYLAAGLFAALVSGTRIVGVFIVLAIVLQAWLDHRQRGGTRPGFISAVLKRPDILVAIFIAPLGLFTYMAYLHWHIGDALAFSHVQRAWGRATGNPLMYLWNALTNFPQGTWWPTVSQQLGAAWLVGIAMTIVMAARRQLPAALFCLVCLTLPLSAGLASMLRFVVGLAPVTVTAMTLLARSRVVYLVSLGVILVGGYFGTVGWLTGVLTLV
ncbi:hypothetical protein JI749_16755 [Devosia oryziradicis]|uniref:Glycosyltransferase RgtA/B/C/D-like domain-containing protein n=1 Tax=Devosia oryziradicis TaxID=2801335 RepID=A0ABX7BW06_9HYPH|nr:hypothetical protein [Devosia oryziradicis]QQR35961.1 hypothetical protein JI749_16755 [Devosia oryziradicis]